MLGVYGWAFMKPIRKLYYNLTITAISVVVAVLIDDSFKLERAFWTSISALNDNFGLLGYGIIGIFVLSWVASAVIYKVMGYNQI